MLEKADCCKGKCKEGFPKREDVSVDLSDEELLYLTRVAHERDITLNNLMNDIIRTEIHKIQEIFDDWPDKVLTTSEMEATSVKVAPHEWTPERKRLAVKKLFPNYVEEEKTDDC